MIIPGADHRDHLAELNHRLALDEGSFSRAIEVLERRIFRLSCAVAVLALYVIVAS